MGVRGATFSKTEGLYAEPDERAEAATSCCSTAGDCLQYIYSVLVAKNRQKIRSGCLVLEFSLIDIF